MERSSTGADWFENPTSIWKATLSSSLKFNFNTYYDVDKLFANDVITAKCVFDPGVPGT